MGTLLGVHPIPLRNLYKVDFGYSFFSGVEQNPHLIGSISMGKTRTIGTLQSKGLQRYNSTKKTGSGDPQLQDNPATCRETAIKSWPWFKVLKTQLKEFSQYGIDIF